MVALLCLMYVYKGFDDAKTKTTQVFISSPIQDQENKDKKES